MGGGFCLVVFQLQKGQFSKMTKNFIHVSSRQLVLVRGGGGGDGQGVKEGRIFRSGLPIYFFLYNKLKCISSYLYNSTDISAVILK